MMMMKLMKILIVASLAGGALAVGSRSGLLRGGKIQNHRAEREL